MSSTPKETQGQLAVTPHFLPALWLCRFVCSHSLAFCAVALLQGFPFLMSGWKGQCQHLLGMGGVDRDFLGRGPGAPFLALNPWFPAPWYQGFSVPAFFPVPGASRVWVHLEGCFISGELGNRLSPQPFWPCYLGQGSRVDWRYLGIYSSHPTYFPASNLRERGFE